MPLSDDLVYDIVFGLNAGYVAHTGCVIASIVRIIPKARLR